MYRHKSWNRKERDRKKKDKKEGWFKTKGEETVIFIPATPKSELKKRYQKIVNHRNLKVRIVEKGGVTLKRMLHKPDPFPDNKCKCLVCETGGSGKCRKTGVVYRLKCETCADIYNGETARNAFTRVGEHTWQLAQESKDSVLHRHLIDKHKNDHNTPKFSAKIIKCYSSSALRRQICESVHINKTPSNKSMNSCQEWNEVLIPRLLLSEGAGGRRM